MSEETVFRKRILGFCDAQVTESRTFRTFTETFFFNWRLPIVHREISNQWAYRMGRYQVWFGGLFIMIIVLGMYIFLCFEYIESVSTKFGLDKRNIV